MLTETPDGFTFANAHWTLTFDAAGHWTGLYASGVDGNLIAPSEPTIAFDVVVDGEWIVVKYGVNFVSCRIEKDEKTGSDSLLVGYVAENPPQTTVDITYKFQADGRRMERHVDFWGSARVALGSKRLLGTQRFTLPGFAVSDPTMCVVDAPGPWTPKAWIRPAMPYGELCASLPAEGWRLRSAPDVGFGLVAVSNPIVSVTFAAWLDTSDTYGATWTQSSLVTNAVPSIQPCGERCTLQFEDTQAFSFETDVITGVHRFVLERAANLNEALQAVREANERSMPMDTQTPVWAREMVLLEVMPTYYPGGFREITERLPFYRDIGFNTIYLMPHWTGEHHGYHPRDLYEVNPAYGTPDELRDLVKTAHALGMRVLFDMVIHGFSPNSPVMAQHPEIFCHNEDGSIAQHRTWKSMTTDWASPAYRDYMTQLALHDLREYDIDGYRVDAAAFKGPNWDPNLPYAAFRSGTESPQLLQALLAALRQVKPETVLLSEVFGPVFYTVCNLAHDNQTEAPAQFLEALEAGTVTAEDYKAHLRNVFALLPAGANRVFFARNHDTSWFYRFGGYTPRFLALDAIHALCGIPEVFAGDPNNGPAPDDDPTTWEYYRRLFRRKRELPELTHGALLLEEVQSDNPRVFTALRRFEGREVVVLVSLSDRPETVRCRFAASRNGLLQQTLEPFAWLAIPLREAAGRAFVEEP